MLEICTNFI